MQGLRLEVLRMETSAVSTLTIRRGSVSNSKGKCVIIVESRAKRGRVRIRTQPNDFHRKREPNAPIRLSVPRPPLLEATGLGLAEDPTAEGRMRTGR